MRPPIPFFWQPAGVVSSLEALPLSGHVLQKRDVTLNVTGKKSDGHPLMVVALADGKVIGDLRLAATRDDEVIGGIQTVFGCDDPGRHYALKRRRFRLPRKRRGTALLLGAANSDNYYHWLLESLPRWKLLQAAGWRNYDFLLLPGRPSRFQDETLDWLGVPPAKRLHCTKNFVHQFERLVVPAMPFPRRSVPDWACDWLRSLVVPVKSGAGKMEKIYLSRRGAGGRRLANEEELETALAQHGFRSIQPEKLTVAEQARALEAARWITAPHGAALTNMVFAPPGAFLLELFHPGHKNLVYANMAAACGHHYASLDGLPIVPAGSRRLEYTVDVASVVRSIQDHS